ncbi:MAG: YbhB/YbcL family Raf kinase inhibitor-like protein [Nanoarchaeota archaeon]|nr:YbhB/YbcL family Raf kinase inhibitor-like protein [Nanoarchaeota archaeon]
MKLTSNAFEHKGTIPAKYTCQGQDINPQLKWEDVPEGTKSFALIVDDPDAPVGTWVHWLVKDIPAGIREIPEDSIPSNQIENDFGRQDYGGPCPPSGTHRYFFKLYALNIETFQAGSKIDFYNKVEEHKIEEAVLMGKYSKG